MKCDDEIARLRQQASDRGIVEALAFFFEHKVKWFGPDLKLWTEPGGSRAELYYGPRFRRKKVFTFFYSSNRFEVFFYKPGDWEDQLLERYKFMKPLLEMKAAKQRAKRFGIDPKKCD